MEVDRSDISETVVLIENVGDCEAVTSVCRMIGFVGPKCYWIGASVKALMWF
jgi:hypothetical protein